MDEAASELRFVFEGSELTLTQTLHIIATDKDADKRAAALECLSKTLGSSGYDKLMARILNVIIGAKGTEDVERGYASPMSSRNIANHVDDATVEALHAAVASAGANAAKRYYRLLSAHLGKAPLRWSDRLAELPFADDRVVSWGECVETVINAYGSFSPTLRDLVQRMIDRNWIDAPPGMRKRGGAFNYSIVLPGNEPRSYNLLNFQGTIDNVMTMAHEAGHGVHGMLAGEAQGPLQFRAPTAYAETASIFGEMTTFQYLLEKATDDEARLALLMGKCADHIGSVVRQISMSNFERRVHELRAAGKLTVEDYSAAWMDATKAFYGEEGELFTYENADNLWSYVSHFTRPFYVYSYAFGELFTQSLFAVKDRFGDAFEGMYLDLLRAGGSKSAVELMKPFGLDPREPAFWTEGIEGSVMLWLDEAEAISRKLGVDVPTA
jgi:oligoendopeptidase F